MKKQESLITVAVLAFVLSAVFLLAPHCIKVSGGWRSRINKVTRHYGMTADISDCSVMLDGKTLEGKLLLAALGDSLFVNEHQVFPHGPERKAQGYVGSIASELRLIYAELVNNRGIGHCSAMQQIGAFALTLPGVWKAEGQEDLHLYFEKHLTRYPNTRVGLQFSPYSLDPEHAAEVIRPCKIKRRDLLIEDRFKEILRSLTSGKTLVIRPGETYSLE